MGYLARDVTTENAGSTVLKGQLLSWYCPSIPEAIPFSIWTIVFEFCNWNDLASCSPTYAYLHVVYISTLCFGKAFWVETCVACPGGASPPDMPWVWLGRIVPLGRGLGKAIIDKFIGHHGSRNQVHWQKALEAFSNISTMSASNIDQRILPQGPISLNLWRSFYA